MTPINFHVNRDLCSKVSVRTSANPIELVFRTEVIDQELPKKLAKKKKKVASCSRGKMVVGDIKGY